MSAESIAKAVAMLTPEKLDEMHKNYRTPISYGPASGDWISAREARLLVADRAKVSWPDAEQAIYRRAARWVPIRVSTFARSEDPHDYIDRLKFFSTSEPTDLSHFSTTVSKKAHGEIRDFFDHLLSGDDFERRVKYALWATGDFKVKVEQECSDVTIEISGLQFDRVALLESLGITSPTSKKPAPVHRIADEAVVEWIKSCAIDNSKIAWAAIHKQYGAQAPKKAEQFEPIWRMVKGNRPRGRPKRQA